MFRFTLLLCLFLAQLDSVYAWWNEDWAYRKVISLDTTTTGVNIAEPTGEVTVLVKLHTGNFGYFFDVREGGADLRFMAADDLTPLKYHVEKLDPINEIALIWVKLPNLQPAMSDKIYMYYGNQTAISGADVSGSFDQAEILAMHFDEVSSPQDKTLNANHPVISNAELNSVSFIGQGAKFNGQSAIQFADSPTMFISSETGWTFSAWLKPDDQTADSTVFEFTDLSTSLSLKQQATSLVLELSSPDGVVKSSASQPLLIADWQHVAVTLVGTQMQLFINGQSQLTSEIPPINMAGRLSLGAPMSFQTTTAIESVSSEVDDTTNTAVVEEQTSLTNTPGFIGEMDEVRISGVARSNAWLMVNANNQGKTSSLMGYGGDESKETEGSAEGGGGGGYFGIIIGNVFGNDHAIVEQVVIGFCGFMAIVAFIIMFFKAATLYTARSASKKFLKAYEGLGASAENLDRLFKSENEFGQSPLFKVYHQGIVELRKRMSPAVGSEFAGLEPKSVSAIRSTLDATMVREGQRINSHIVLLTIAISGGPFIGLLGTVVGVMVTFAGIAAAGEVNINAIAPGMAAALLATVAGLGVAIPALFGYNYLGAQIRELNADMHVFTEEFLGRVNESFGR